MTRCGRKRPTRLTGTSDDDFEPNPSKVFHLLSLPPPRGPYGFIHRALGLGMSQDVIDSTDTYYIMRPIADIYSGDSTVTMVLNGRCTWARRYVDSEIHASLRSGQWVLPNGLLGIVLPSAGWQPITPDRLRMNLSLPMRGQWYARWTVSSKQGRRGKHGGRRV